MTMPDCRERWILCPTLCAAVPDAVGDAGESADEPPACRRGYVLVLPGIWNTRFQFRRFVAAARAQLRCFDVEVRLWGIPLLGLHNLSAYRRNLETAVAIANDLVVWRKQHPSGRLYVVGYSGGGGLATLVAASLPAGVAVDRLILVAPAISPGFPLEDLVLPHVNEFTVNYSSSEDLQVGWGTSVFGTVDRQRTKSAGSVGFDVDHPRLLQWRWSATDADGPHHGNHWSYLKSAWQRSALLPALDPAVGARQLQERWHRGGGSADSAANAESGDER